MPKKNKTKGFSTLLNVYTLNLDMFWHIYQHQAKQLFKKEYLQRH